MRNILSIDPNKFGSEKKRFAKVDKKTVRVTEAEMFGGSYDGHKFYKPYFYEIFFFWLRSPFRSFARFWASLTMGNKIAIIFNVFATTTSIIAIIISFIALNKN